MRFISYLANPARFLRFSKYATPISGWLALTLIGTGVALGLFISPSAIEHGEAVRIMYVHVPAAWCAMAAYTAIALASFVSIVWRHNLADSVARSLAILAMAGWLNIPIIKYSVDWWNTLHQPATVSDLGAPGLPIELLLPLLIMALGYTALLAWFVFRGTEAELAALRRHRENSSKPATVTLETLAS